MEYKYRIHFICCNEIEFECRTPYVDLLTSLNDERQFIAVLRTDGEVVLLRKDQIEHIEVLNY